MRTVSITAIFGSCGGLIDFDKPGVCNGDIGPDPHVEAARLAGGTAATPKTAEYVNDDMSGVVDPRGIPVSDDAKPLPMVQDVVKGRARQASPPSSDNDRFDVV